MKIYAPNVHLFAFQLYKGSNIDANLSTDDLNFLWESGDAVVRETLKRDLQISQHLDIHKPESKRVDLLKDAEVIDDNYALSFDGQVSYNQHQNLLVTGLAHPLRFSDSYGLWLNLRRPEQENNQQTEDLETDFLQVFNPNNCLFFPKHRLFLGQALLITGWLTSAKDKNNIRQIADECLNQIFPNQSTAPPFYRQGQLFGSPIFEYGLTDNLANYQHVLVWLFADNQADINLNKCFQELIDLFFHRTKVVKAYQDSRKIYKELDSVYRQIETTIDNIPERQANQPATHKYLQELQKQLKTFPQLAFKYARLLRNLEEYANTIAINVDNYNIKLKVIQDTLPKEDLSFLAHFTQNQAATFQRQIQADLGYFNNGSQLLDQAINSIRGIVEIEQTESDRSLERTVQILGIGFGGGAIASGIIVQHIDKINRPISLSLNYPPHPFYASLILSILATSAFIYIGFLITKRK
ncbi:MAG TPA: hypothetical protein VK203_02730 [Nostocaceae cyanobacterium]|nr:hypothetical protein [Nostocaceae cyanobacterium]